jgi:hypothetical protein
MYDHGVVGTSLGDVYKAALLFERLFRSLELYLTNMFRPACWAHPAAMQDVSTYRPA